MIRKFNEFLNEAEETEKEKKEERRDEPVRIFYGHKKISKDGYEYYNDIYESPFGTKMCGGEQIYELAFSVSEDMEIDKDPIEYWGWKDDEKRVSMVFPKYFLFNMCFPAGAKKTEELGQGKRVKLLLIGAEIFQEKKDEDEEERKRKKRRH